MYLKSVIIDLINFKNWDLLEQKFYLLQLLAFLGLPFSQLVQESGCRAI
tara:strand:+ start:70 stop:216 length:147 start_codon:yes stop_codon:yes gene_type:complete